MARRFASSYLFQGLIALLLVILFGSTLAATGLVDKQEDQLSKNAPFGADWTWSTVLQEWLRFQATVGEEALRGGPPYNRIVAFRAEILRSKLSLITVTPEVDGMAHTAALQHSLSATLDRSVHQLQMAGADAATAYNVIASMSAFNPKLIDYNHRGYGAVLTAAEVNRMRAFSTATRILKTMQVVSGVGLVVIALLSLQTRRLTQTRKLIVAEKESAELAADAKSKMLRATAHDLRQPMQSMFIFSDAMKNEHSPEKRRDLLYKMEDALMTQQALIESLSNVAKLDSGRLQPKIERFLIHTLMEEIRGAYTMRASQKGLVLAIDYPNVIVKSDPLLLGRMIRNLLENAFTYTEKGSITVKSKVQGSHLVIAVSDTGTGIPGDQIENIWSEFHQIRPSGRTSTNLGLGLSIVKTLGNLMGHAVGAESVVGKGSAFHIQIPCEAYVGSKPLRGPEETKPQTAHSTSRPLVVMIVDDDPLVLDGLYAAVTMAGHTPVAAASGSEAVKALKLFPFNPDVIMADYKLRGGETGVDVIKYLRQVLSREIPSVILTGDLTDGADSDPYLEDILVLQKPVPVEELIEAVERISIEPVASSGMTVPTNRLSQRVSPHR